MNRLRLAVIGAGHLGRIHGRLASSLDDFELVAVVDPIGSSREKLAHELGCQAYDHFAALIGKVDAAVVATPTVHHHKVGLELIRHGIDLLIEKPLAKTAAEAGQLANEARDRNVILQVGHVERFNPALEAVLPEIENPKYIDATRTSGFSFRSTDIGVVLDLMIHDLDIALTLANSEIVETHALGLSLLGGHEDLAQARLQLANGCVINLTASRCSYVAQRRMQIFGEQAFAAIDFGDHLATIVRPSEAVLQRQVDVDRLTPEEKSHLREHLFSELLPAEQLVVDDRNAILEELRDFARSIRTRQASRVTAQHGFAALHAADLILAKIAEHRWSSVAAGPAGPHIAPAATILAGPHVSESSSDPAPHRRAG